MPQRYHRTSDPFTAVPFTAVPFTAVPFNEDLYLQKQSKIVQNRSGKVYCYLTAIHPTTYNLNHLLMPPLFFDHLLLNESNREKFHNIIKKRKRSFLNNERKIVLFSL